MTIHGLLRNSSFLSGLFAVIAGLGWGLASFAMRDNKLGDPNAPRYFPWLVAGLAIVCGLMLIGREVLRAVPSEDTLNLKFVSVYRAAVIGSVLGVVYALAFDRAGFIPSTILFVGGISFAYNGLARWKSNIITAVVFSVVVYYLFTTLGTQLTAFPEF